MGKIVKDGEGTPVENIIELTDEILDDDLGTTADKDGRVLREGEKIYDLVDVVEEVPHCKLNGEIAKKVSEIAEKIARELVPEIAERVIRKEIEKLKDAD